MKKYILATILVLTLVVIGGIKFFGNVSVTDAASYPCTRDADGDAYCLAHGYGNSCSRFDGTCANNLSVGNGSGTPPPPPGLWLCEVGSTGFLDGNCYHCNASTDGTSSSWGLVGASSNGSASGCNALSVGGPSSSNSGLSWSSNVFSLLYATAVNWMDVSGNKVTPKQIFTHENYYDQSGNQIFLSGVDSSKASPILNSLLYGRVGNGSTARALPCGSLGHGSNGVVNGAGAQCCDIDTGGGIYAWALTSAHSCDAITAGGGSSATQSQ